MNYANVQQLIETRMIAGWTATELALENQPFNTDLYDEFARVTVQFGDTVLRSLGTRCYRTLGILFLDLFVRPAVGSHRLAVLSDLGTALLAGQSFTPVLPATGPVVHFLEPSLSKSYAERTGWVSAQLQTTFYFDTEV